MRLYLEEVDISTLINSQRSCEDKEKLLELIINTGMDRLLPLKSKTIVTSEPPWINQSLKCLIRKRQKALDQEDEVLFRTLRNRVNCERKMCRAKYFKSKVEHLMECKPASWWKEVKKLSGMTTVNSSQTDLISTLQHIGCDQGEGTVSNSVLANVINEAFLAPMSHFAPLQTEEFVPNSPVFEGCCLQVSEFSVNKKLSTLNPTKATRPDGIPSWLLKDNADIFAVPVSNILNRSFLEA
jgi:hypothetical protein